MQSHESKTRTRISRIARIAAGGILIMALVPKFLGAPESIALFETLGVEPWGRWGTGSAELIAAVLLNVPGLAVYGGLLTLGLMGGALGSHLTVLGVEVDGDGGTLFALASVTFALAATVTWLQRAELPRRSGSRQVA